MAAAVGAIGNGAAAGAGAAGNGRLLDQATSALTAWRPVRSNNRVVVHVPNHEVLIGATHLQSAGKPFPRELIALVLSYIGQNIYTDASHVPCRELVNGSYGVSFSRDEKGHHTMGALHAGGRLYTVRSLEEEGEPRAYEVPYLDHQVMGLSRLAMTSRGVFRAPMEYLPYMKFLRYPPQAGALVVEERGCSKQGFRPNVSCTTIGAYTYDPLTDCLFTMNEGDNGMDVAYQGREDRRAVFLKGKRVLAAGGDTNILVVTTQGIFTINVSPLVDEDDLALVYDRAVLDEEESLTAGHYRAAVWTSISCVSGKFVMQDNQRVVWTYAPYNVSGPSRAFHADFGADFLATNQYGTVALLPRDASQCSLWDLATGVHMLTLHPEWVAPVVSEGFALSCSSLCIEHYNPEQRGGVVRREVTIYDLRRPAARPAVTITQP